MKTRLIMSLAVLVALATGIWIGGNFSKQNFRSPAPSAEPSLAVSQDSGAAAVPESPNTESSPAAPPPAPAISSGSPAPATVPRPALTTIKELNALADGPLPLAEKVKALSAVAMGADAKFGAKAAERLAFIVGRDDYAAMLKPLIVDPKLPSAAREVLALNLYDRPFKLSLTTWSAILENPTHPMAAEAADALKFHLKEKGELRGAALAAAISDFLKQ